MYDAIIIGAGPAGMSAALYAVRGQLNTLVLEKKITGGQIAMTELVENYPGFPDGESGANLAERCKQQAEKFGAKFKDATVTAIRRNEKTFTLVTENEELETRSVICAMGADPRKLGVPGEDQNVGKGVSYCATCDGFFFRDKKIVVVGGGDAAVEEGLFLTRFASSVSIIHRRDELRASKILQERVFAHEKMDVIWDTIVTKINSDEQKVKSVTLKNVKTEETQDFETDGVFIFVGHIPNTQLVKDLLELDESQFNQSRSEYAYFDTRNLRLWRLPDRSRAPDGQLSG